MAGPIHVTVEPAVAQVIPGARLTLSLTLANEDRAAHPVHLSLSGLPHAWYDLADTGLTLEPGARRTIPLVLHPALDTTFSAGSYPFRVQVASDDDPAVYASTVVALSVGEAGELRLDVRPQEAQGAQGAFRVDVVNEMSWPATVLLTAHASGAADALRIHVKPDGALVVPAGATRTVTVQVAPRVRNGPQTFDLTLQGVQPGQEQAQRASLTRRIRFHYRGRRGSVALPRPGQLPRWAFLVPLVLLLALVAAAGSGRLAGALSSGGGTGRTASPPAASPTPAGATWTPTARATPTHLVHGVTARGVAIPEFALRHGSVGALYRLVWRTRGARRVTLNGRIVAAVGQRVLQPPLHTATYRLAVANASHHAAATVRVVVGGGVPPGPHTYVLALPRIAIFTLHRRGSHLVATWWARGATSVRLQGRPVVASGSELVDPALTQVRLVARNAVGSTTRQLAAPRLPTPTPMPRPTVTQTPRPTATLTPHPTPTRTPRPTATHTPRPTATRTPRPTVTSTPRPTRTPTATHTPHPTATPTRRPTKTPTATRTPRPTASATPTVTAPPRPTDTPSATPTTAPTATATPTATTTAGAGPTVAAGSAPALLFNPTAVHFGTQSLGQTSAAQAIHVVNLGPGTLAVSSIVVTGPAAGDFAVRDTCGGRSLDPVQGCVIAVRFTPRAAGERRATLIVTDNATGSPQRVALQGHA